MSVMENKGLFMWLLLVATAVLVSSFPTTYDNHVNRRHRKSNIKYKYKPEKQDVLEGREGSLGFTTTVLFNTVKEALAADPDFEVFTRLLKQADLEDIEASIGE